MGQGPNGAPIAGEVGKWVDTGTYWLSCRPEKGGLPWVPSPPPPAPAAAANPGAAAQCSGPPTAMASDASTALEVANLAFFKAHASRFKRITTSEESAYA
eukprot:2131646-Heterocapsa_arctica.AAC.1